MIGSNLFPTTAQLPLLVINVLLIVSWITVFACAGSFALRYRPASRHRLLCLALVLALVSPFITLLRQGSHFAAFRISTADPGAMNSGSATALEFRAIRDLGDEPNEELPPEIARILEETLVGLSNPEASSVATLLDKKSPDAQKMGMSFDFDIQELEEADLGPDQIIAPISDYEFVESTWHEESRFDSFLRAIMLPTIGVWLAGAVLLLIRLGFGLRRLHILVQKSQRSQDSSTESLFSEVCTHLRLRQIPKLMISDHISSPISVGLFKPCVILPAALIERIHRDQLRQILTHEAAHILRHDVVIVFLQNVAGSLFWLHPLVAVLNRQLAKAREEICDNFVLAQVDASTYGKTLLDVVTNAHAGFALHGALGLYTSRWKLEHRIAGLLDRRRDARTQLAWRDGAAITALTLFAGLVGTFGTVSVALDQPQSEFARQNNPSQEPFAAKSNTEVGKQDSLSSLVDAGLLTLNLRVTMPDGSPAANVNVTSLSQFEKVQQRFTTDSTGQVTIQSEFGHGANLHAISADGKLQATLSVDSADSRKHFAKPVQLKLLATREHPVTVTADDKAVSNALVVAKGDSFQIQAETDTAGIARLRLPADDAVKSISAWHPEFGVNGKSQLNEKPAQNETALSLMPSAPVAIEVVDPLGTPVPGLELSASFVSFQKRIQSEEWCIYAEGFPATSVTTNEKGEATVAWPPRDRLTYLHFKTITPEWTIDEVNPMSESKRLVKVHVRRLKPVIGRVVAPEGLNPEGLLIQASGSGPGHYGDLRGIRVRSDGTFAFNAPSNYGYMFSLIDHEWASEPWTGLVRKSDDAEPAEIILKLHRATPITVRVTQGHDKRPLAGALVEIGQMKHFSYSDDKGERQNVGGSTGNWIKTDANGIVRTGAPAGKTQVRAAFGKRWDERQNLKVTSDQPLEVTFHCKTTDEPEKHKVVARLTHNGAAYHASKKVEVHAWSSYEMESTGGFSAARVPSVHRATVRDDPEIEVSFEDPNVSLLVIDSDAGLSGFVKVAADKSTTEIEMRPLATYKGKLVDQEQQPLVDQELRLFVASFEIRIGSSLATSPDGQFELTGIPAAVPIRAYLKQQDGNEKRYHVSQELSFEPGEVRQDVTIQAYRLQDEKNVVVPAKAEKRQTLAERENNAERKALVSGMRTLVILNGDDSEQLRKVVDALLGENEDDKPGDEEDAENLEPIYNYLPVTVSNAELQSVAADLKEANWVLPGAAEITLTVFEPLNRRYNRTTISVSDFQAAKTQGIEFLNQNKPRFPDAIQQLESAQQLAKESRRRVLLITSGPRCGPCFQLAEWMQGHHDLIEKDYVVVKLMGGLQPGAEKINEQIGGSQHGIPWYVITEPDGTILVTSESAVGNIGMPSSIEGVRHFRKMLEQTARNLSAKEIDSLVKSFKIDGTD